MLGWLTERSRRRRNGQQLYERIVAQARSPSLYESCRVPDTMDGRLEMLLLHTVLTLERLRPEGAEGQRLGQRLMERLIADVDDALRQIGLGDDSVAIRMKRLAGALAERSRDYGLRPGEGDTSALALALARHVYGAADGPQLDALAPDTHRLADYVARARMALARLDRRDVLAGHIDFPPVEEPAIDTPEASP